MTFAHPGASVRLRVEGVDVGDPFDTFTIGVDPTVHRAVWLRTRSMEAKRMARAEVRARREARARARAARKARRANR